MWFERFGEYINRGFKEAALVALLFSFIPLMGWVGIVIMALITLRKSPEQGLGILLICSIPSLWMLGFGINVPWVIAMLVGNVLTWFLAVTLRNSASWGKVFLASMAFSIVTVFILHLIVPDLHNYWFEVLQKFYTQADKDAKILLQVPPKMDLKNYLQNMAKILTPMLVLAQVMLSLANVLIARWWQASLFNPGGLGKELLNTRLSIWATAILAATAAVTYMGVTAGWDLLPTFIMLFFLSGLVVVHHLLRRYKANTIWGWFFYGVVILLAPYSVIAIAGLGVTNTFIDFRAKEA